MLDGRHDLTPCRAVGTKLVGDDALRHPALRRRATEQNNELSAIIGIDDFAFRRGQTYGTIVCDLERRRPVILLPDRTLETSRAWLAAHPSISTVARDRGGGYGEAIPLRDGLKRDIYATLGKRIFDVTQAESKPIVKPYRVGNDLSGQVSIVTALAAEVGKAVHWGVRNGPCPSGFRAQKRVPLRSVTSLLMLQSLMTELPETYHGQHDDSQHRRSAEAEAAHPCRDAWPVDGGRGSRHP
ncbi:transposase [Mycoplana azooxidifex]|uniref:transposase n=1 Tax=Mycoplana azooxidifex TaxID=1636188 RepID=UPI003CCD751F